MPRLVVAGVLVERGRALILRRSASDSYPGRWELPSGVVKSREHPEVALVREFAEETGLRVRPVRPIRVTAYTMGGQHTVQINYIVRRLGGRLRLAEHDAAAWIGLKNIRLFDVFPDVAVVIRDVLRRSRWS